MNRRHLTPVLVISALIGLGVLIAYNTEWQDVPVRTPPKGEALTNRTYALEHLLNALGVRTRHIPSLDALSRDAVLFVDDLSADFAHVRVRSVEEWVEAGGRLVIPGYLLASNVELQQWSAVTPVGRAHRTFMRNVEMNGEPLPWGQCRPWEVHVRGREAATTLCMGTPAVVDGYASHRTPLWSLSVDPYGTQILRIVMDRGELTVIGPSAFLSNQMLIEHDHARALIEAAGLKRTDTVLILTPAKAEPLLALLWRWVAPALVFLMLAALALIVRHWPRFGPAEPDPAPQRRSLAEQIAAHARFAWRTHRLGPLRNAVRGSLIERASRTISGFASLSPQAQAQALARLTGLEPQALHAALTVQATGDRHTQLAALGLLERARRALGSSSDTPPSSQSSSRSPA